MPRQRLRIRVEGAVQGVGFRPFLYRQAVARGVDGWVYNDGGGVTAELEGEGTQLEALIAALRHEAPAGSMIGRIGREALPVQQERGFVIRESSDLCHGHALIPDTALCASCIRELNDPADRRHRYPFITCNSCGPRLSMLTRGPFDRANTSMRRFGMCPECQGEYEDAGDRRFHAQGISCPACGPRLWGVDAGGMELHDTDEAVMRAVERLKGGEIVAVKGVGGFHLLCRADDTSAIARLRTRKRRPGKPLAVMFASVAAIRRHCHVTRVESTLLQSATAPIVLLERREASSLPESLAPGLNTLGAMLPYTPLHSLLIEGVGTPLVATSGNLSGAPICHHNRQAYAQLFDIADCLLLHDRAIVRPLEDSVVRVVLGAPLWLRLGRGRLPLTLAAEAVQQPVLAMGGHMKASLAIGQGGHVHVGPLIAEGLDGVASRYRYRKELRSMSRLFDIAPERLACDAHPDWASAREAERRGLPVTKIQHHHAHVRAVMGEHGLTGPLLGFAWDGTGWGEGDEIRGSECLRVDAAGYARLATLRPFSLPGGEAAMRRPARLALGLLHAVRGDAVFDDEELHAWLDLAPSELALLRPLLEGGMGTADCSSMGRLFDAVAALLGYGLHPTYEGEAAMRLEAMVDPAMLERVKPYPFELNRGEPLQIDWRLMLAAIKQARRRGIAGRIVAARFHKTLAAMAVAVARRAGLNDVVLSGGCFQNAHLLAETTRQLRAAGFTVYRPRRLPPNDGALAVGQLFAMRDTATGGR
jgi:hydrogenase maturation protein HypF